MFKEYTVVYMPLTADGNGPASPDETIYETWEVWDATNNTVVSCLSHDHADTIVAALNQEPLYYGSVTEFDR